MENEMDFEVDRLEEALHDAREEIEQLREEIEQLREEKQSWHIGHGGDL